MYCNWQGQEQGLAASIFSVFCLTYHLLCCVVQCFMGAWRREVDRGFEGVFHGVGNTQSFLPYLFLIHEPLTPLSMAEGPQERRNCPQGMGCGVVNQASLEPGDLAVRWEQYDWVRVCDCRLGLSGIREQNKKLQSYFYSLNCKTPRV